MKLEFCRQNFGEKEKAKISNVFKILSMGAELFVADGQRHDETNTRFSQFWERA
jgi:hypothetical protein